MKNWIAKTRIFLAEVKAEVGKVSFPSREELIGTTTVVLVTSAVFAAYLWVADLGIQWVLVEVFGR